MGHFDGLAFITGKVNLPTSRSCPSNAASVLASSSQAGEGSRVTLLRRADGGRNCLGLEELAANGPAPLGSRQGMVAAGIEALELRTVITEP